MSVGRFRGFSSKQLGEKIPFNRPGSTAIEFSNIKEALKSGYVAGGGSFSKRTEAELSRAIGNQALLTTSCTHALEIAALLLELEPGDEVIVPSFAFVSCANAFVLRGARTVFVDVDPKTFNIAPAAVAGAITAKTRAVVIIHYAGIACDIAGITEAIGARDIAVIEDNAHGLFGTYRGKPLGSFGRFATLSFHETKNYHCGEGGAIVLERAADLRRAEILREKGTDRAAFFRGQVDKYRWVDIGSSYVMSDILAAFLFAQLSRRETIQKRRRRIWERYHEELFGVCLKHGWAQPVVPSEAEPAYHLYFLVLESAERRSAFIEHLANFGIQAVFHYQSLHKSPFARQTFGAFGDCPNSDLASDRLVRLPFFADLSERDQDRIVEAILDF